MRVAAIDDDGHAGRPGLGDGRPEDLVVQNALRVVGYDHDVGLGKRIADRGDHAARGLLGDRFDDFVVGPQQLLSVGEKARLHRGRSAGFDDQLRGETGLGFGEIRDLQRQPVFTGDRDQCRVRAERGHVAGHVAGAAEHGLLRADPQDRDRRFGRDALDASMHESIEHHVADAQNARSRECIEDGLIVMTVVHRWPV
jgi:hypothetical protein